MKRIQWTLLCICLGGLLMAAPDVKAQDDETTTETTEKETDPVTEALKKEKEKAELKKAIAEAEKATLAAKLPETEGSGVEGSVTFGEGTGYFAEVLAYESLSAAAVKIAKAAGKPSASDSVVLVVTGDELAGTAHLWEIANVRVDDAKQRVESLLAKYDDYDFEEAEAVATALATATAALSAAADIASFFRSDLTLTAREVEIPVGALVTAVAGEMATQGWKPRIPTASLESTQLLVKIEGLLAERRKLVARRAELETTRRELRREFTVGLESDLRDKSLAELEAELAKAEKGLAKAQKDGKDTAELEQKVATLAVIVPALGTLKARWDRVAGEIDANLTVTDELVKALTEGADGKPSVVEAVAAVDVAKANPKAAILRLDLVGQGGEVHVRKSRWRTRLTYVGGVSAEYRWMDQSGLVKKAGVITVPRAKSMKARDFTSEEVGR